MEQLRTAVFPESFRFGVADADLQVMGERHCIEGEKSEPSLWVQFAQQSGKVWNDEPPLECIDRYHRWKEDLEILRQLGTKHYRTSVSMCRTMRRDGSVNEEAIAWYRAYFEALKRSGFSLYVTIYHWELPLWLHEQGGWKNRAIVDHLVRHALIVQERLGDLIDEYFILNEPFQFTWLSYHLGEHAPGETDLRGALLTVHHALLAQGEVFRALKQKDSSLKLGTVCNSRPFYALTTDPADLEARTLAEEYQTRIFLDPVFRGVYPEYLRAKLKDVWPEEKPGDLESMKIGDGLHAFGLNFYRGMVIAADPTHDVGFREIQYPQGVKNGLGWPVYLPPTYPEGLYDLLRELWHRYGSLGMQRIYISENGTCWDEKPGADGKVHDDFRIFYVREHLRQAQKAMLAGVPLEGYFLWTLMDNYEWDMGFKPGSNFGIVHVDRATMRRTPKDSFHWYRDLIGSRTLR